MRKNKIKEMISSLSDNFLISRPSILKYLSSFLISWWLRLNQVGIKQYTARTPNKASPQRIIDSVNSTSDKREIIPTPAAADLRITFRSLLRNFAIGRSHFIGFIYTNIIPQKSWQVSLLLAVIFIFTYALPVFASEECLAAIVKYEQLYKIPTGLLQAVSKVESEYNPLALNDGLKSHKFKTKEEVIDRINYLVGIGKTNFDIGCMQINYYWHGKNFASIEEMLDVTGNVRYAASLIHGLYKSHGTWQAAVRHYHSYEPTIHKQYSKKIALAWLQEK